MALHFLPHNRPIRFFPTKISILDKEPVYYLVISVGVPVYTIFTDSRPLSSFGSWVGILKYLRDIFSFLFFALFERGTFSKLTETPPPPQIKDSAELLCKYIVHGIIWISHLESPFQIALKILKGKSNITL